MKFVLKLAAAVFIAAQVTAVEAAPPQRVTYAMAREMAPTSAVMVLAVDCDPPEVPGAEVFYCFDAPGQVRPGVYILQRINGQPMMAELRFSQSPSSGATSISAPAAAPSSGGSRATPRTAGTPIDALSAVPFGSTRACLT